MADWNDEKKERGKKKKSIIEYTSSDESEVSDDENGPERKRFLTRGWHGKVQLLETSKTCLISNIRSP